MTISKLFNKVFGEEICENFPEKTEENGSCHSRQTARDATGTRRDLEEMSLSQQMDVIKQWLQGKLNTCDANCETALQMQRENMKSRLGPDLVIFDIDFSSTVRVAMDRLTVRSQGSFNTIKANVCVFGGRWMYEVHLHSKGVMQIGWASNKCVFNDNSGVGDSKMSYGYDGSKKQKWHISTNEYGEKWEIGDIIGVTIDVDSSQISYYRNGKYMGVAFNRLEKGPGITFFPAISLAYSQAVRANFGNFPFKYPVEGYLPLQAKPLVQLQKVDLLLGYLVNLATILALKASCREKKQQKDDKLSTRKTVYVLFSTLITEKLANWIFDEYVIEDKLLSYIRNVSSESNAESEEVLVGSTKNVLGNLLSIFANYFENEEYKFLLKKMVNCLLAIYTHTHKGMDYSHQLETLHIMYSLCKHPITRKNLIEFKLFKKHCLPLFMYIRPPEFSYMQQFAEESSLWTEGLGGSKQNYNGLINKVEKTVENLYALQKKFLLILLTNNDGDENGPSSRKLFLSKLRKYVIDASIEHRPFPSFFLMQSTLQHPIENTVSLSFICILADVNRTLLEKEIPNLKTGVLAKLFVDGTLEYQQFDRLGGVVSHLRKAHRNEIISHLGAETANVLLDEERAPPRFGDIEPHLILSAGPMNNIIVMNPNQGSVQTVFAHFLNPRTHVSSDVSFGNCNAENSLFELLDISVIYYYSVGHKYIVKIAATRDEIATLNLALLDNKYSLEDVEKRLQILDLNLGGQTNEHVQLITEMKANFLQRQQVFKKRSSELSRKQIWYRSVALSKQRTQLLTWLLEKTLSTLNSSSELGPLFSFAPEVYINILPILLDTVMDFAFHDLTEQFDISNAENVVKMSAEFLSLHAADSRIIIASCKDSILQALGTLSSHKAGMLALEKCSKKSQNALIRALLRPYENRAWGQSNWLLLRFWFGDGFAYRTSRSPCVWLGGNTPIQTGICRSRAKNEQHTGLLHHIAPANPSKYFQRVIGAKLIEDETTATIFLNSVLTQLNWAFSEFILLLQDMQNMVNRQEMTIPDSKQSKICVMCFELTVSLMRCLEMIISIAPNMIHDPSRPNSDLILARISQLCSQVLSRVTVPPGCFQFIVDMCTSDLNSITHFPIITAALGILLALMRPELDANKNPAKVTRITRALLTDPSFQFANLEFALGEIRTPILQQTEIPRGNFDPQTRAHIDPLTNDVRVALPRTSTKRIRSEPPLIKFALQDYPTHITQKEIEDVHLLIGMLRLTQALLSDIILPSEDSLCPICCAKPIAVIFYPCKHQSCSYCIMQHLTNSKLCFYCKTMIKTIETLDGETIFTNNEFSNPHLIEHFN